ncbi:MAG: sugar ABC transporter substrate-binding protein [Desulfitobacteriaceae bacterium]
MKRKISLLLVILLVINLMLTGCASSTADRKEKTFKVGITTFGLANDYIRVGRDSAADQAKKDGIELIASVDDSVAKRTAAIENFITQGVSAIIVHEGDFTQVKPALEQAKKKGIFVIAMNSGYDDLADLVVEPDNTKLGEVAAEEMAKLTGNKGNIVEIYNDLGAMIKARKEAMHNVIKKYPDMKITNGFVYAWPDFFPDAKAKMEAILQAHPKPGEISAVFATFYGVGLAAAQAIREKGLQNNIVVVGIDSDPETFTEMKKPDSPYKATVMSDPDYLGRTSIDKLLLLLKGEKLAEKHIFVPSKLITKDNIPAQ